MREGGGGLGCGSLVLFNYGEQGSDMANRRV